MVATLRWIRVSLRDLRSNRVVGWQIRNPKSPWGEVRTILEEKFCILCLMIVHHTLVGPWILALAAVAVSPAVQAQMLAAEQPAPVSEYLWLDVDGQPLPFQDNPAIEAALRSATVINRKEIGRGVAGAEKVVLEHDGVRFHAAFRTVNVREQSSPVNGAKRPKTYRDAAIFECAAYELSELLGIGRVPPAVARRIDGESGTIQIWMEETRPEVVVIEQGVFDPPDAVRFYRQKQIMRLFDILIANSDRNQGNLLIDRNWNIWFIDHTRAFRQSSALVDPDGLTMCERSQWVALRAADEATIRARMEPYLESREISSLLLRQRKLIDFIQELIDTQGEDAVLFDLPPPATATIGRND